MTTVTTRAPAASPSHHTGGGALAGTGTLIRLILRRDRIRIPAWLAALTLFQVSVAASYPDLYPTAADRQDQAEIFRDNPAMTAMGGPGHGLDNYTYGAMQTNEMLGFMVIFVALMSVLLIVRHTRAEEESGRAELLRAAVVGRHAPLTAALAVVAGANLLLGLLVAAGMGGLGIESMTWTGSVAYGAAFAAVGVVFAGIAALTAQLTEHSRAAAGTAGVLIGAAYVLRAIGDMGNGVLSWLSPIGWAQAVRPYVGERWWPLALAAVVTGLFMIPAYRLSARRDLGAGLTQPRVGRSTAPPSLVTPQGFAFRLQRASVIAWAAAMFAFAAAEGAAAGIIEDYSDNEVLREMMAAAGGDTLTESWLSMVMSLIAMVCTIFAIVAALRPRREETSGRAEPVLATALSRTRWLSTHLAVAFVGGVGVLLAAGLGLGLAAAASTGDAGLLWKALGAMLAYAPALWLTTALAVAVFGLVPRAIGLAWALLGYAIAIGYFGEILQTPDWLNNLSPFGHTPRMPADDFTAVPLLILTVLAAGLVAVGVAGFRRRDLESA
jgi:ABC-2 type transport system permease protein